MDLYCRSIKKHILKRALELTSLEQDFFSYKYPADITKFTFLFCLFHMFEMWSLFSQFSPQ